MKTFDNSLGSLYSAEIFQLKGVSRMEQRVPEVGQAVIWHNSVGVPSVALVTAVHTPACLNLVIVSEPGKTDQYGRQIERLTSCVHKVQSGVHGFYWRFLEEAPNPIVKPLAV